MVEKLIIRDVTFLGPGQEPATIKFQSGLNVVCGASETGKSFLVEAIDYFLGGKRLKDIPERVGYDRGRIGLEVSNGEAWTLERSVSGGNYNVYEGIISDALVDKVIGSLKAKHSSGKDDNISGLLLKRIDLFDKHIRKNKAGANRSLSFRDIARLIIVNEKEIIRQETPFLSGQFITKTAEYSALKLLLTGIDDTAVVPIKKDEPTETGIKAKVELIDEWIEEIEAEIDAHNVTKEELQHQFQKLENTISSQREVLSGLQTQLHDSIALRREVVQSRETIQDRLDEINDLLDRFALLRHHYTVDLNRLMAIEESGSLFVHHDRVKCPLCGALPDEQHVHEFCDGDVESVVRAASAEIEKIKALASDLKSTITDLMDESRSLTEELGENEAVFNEVDEQIRGAISPNLSDYREIYTGIVEKKNEVSIALNAYAKLEKLIAQKDELMGADTDENQEDNGAVKTDISKHILNRFSSAIQKILETWNFPDVKSVYFDEAEKDFVINGKLRGNRGKGLRAITHAAVTLGLLEFCKTNELPHPGFVVMDSPLQAYYEPEGDDDDLQGSDLKEKFYQYLIDEHSDNQVIIIENQHPPVEFEDQIKLEIFTKNPYEGRFGLFPYRNELA